jgi:hypothetical protein
MIRRLVQLDDGRPAWLLVSQRDHAALAAELSERAFVSATLGSDPAIRQEVEWTIRHHDDGWLDWDEAPGFADDPPGQPRSFDEMRIEDAQAIWARSIQEARRRGPLAAWLVIRHFLYLRSVSSSATDPAATRFARQFEPLADACWREWLETTRFADRSAAAASDPAEVAQRGLDRLRWADRLSLCLCGDPPARPDGLVLRPTPLGVPQRLTWDPSLLALDLSPQAEGPGKMAEDPGKSDSRPDFRFGYRIQPWLADPDPLPGVKADNWLSPGKEGSAARSGPRLVLRWRARQVPVAEYSSVQELNRASRVVGILGVLGGSGCVAD